MCHMLRDVRTLRPPPAQFAGRTLGSLRETERAGPGLLHLRIERSCACKHTASIKLDKNRNSPPLERTGPALVPQQRNGPGTRITGRRNTARCSQESRYRSLAHPIALC